MQIHRGEHPFPRDMLNSIISVCPLLPEIAEVKYGCTETSSLKCNEASIGASMCDYCLAQQSVKSAEQLTFKVDELIFRCSVPINNEIALLILMCMLSTTSQWIAE